MSSFPLTFICFRGVETTNQMKHVMGFVILTWLDKNGKASNMMKQRDQSHPVNEHEKTIWVLLGKLSASGSCFFPYLCSHTRGQHVPKEISINLTTCFAGDGGSSFLRDAGMFRADMTWCDGIWVYYNELTASSLEIIVSKGNHPQMALIQVSELL